jgi:hypothetical protein
MIDSLKVLDIIGQVVELKGPRFSLATTARSPEDVTHVNG